MRASKFSPKIISISIQGLRTDFIDGKAIKSNNNKQIRANRRTNQELESDIEQIKEFLENQRQKSSKIPTIPSNSLSHDSYFEDTLDENFFFNDSSNW